ncbi:hypothetical protein ACHAPJ_006163 [Fusarium lateritium]
MIAFRDPVDIKSPPLQITFEGFFFLVLVFCLVFSICMAKIHEEMKDMQAQRARELAAEQAAENAGDHEHVD